METNAKKLPRVVNSVVEGISNYILGYLYLVILGLILGGLVMIHNSIWGEQEGFTKADDCRSSIGLTEGSFDTWFKRFTCTTKKTQSGKIISGVCVSVVTEGPVCQTAYTYQKKPQITCSNPNFPFPGYDDICHSNLQ